MIATDERWYAEHRPAAQILSIGLGMGLELMIRQHLESGKMGYETALLVEDSLRLRDPTAALRADILKAFPELRKKRRAG